MTDHEQHETEAQSNLKEEIADYLSEYHGGRDTDLNAIEAAEHIVTKLAEPHIRAMIAEEIEDHIGRVFGGRPNSSLTTSEMIAKTSSKIAAQIALGAPRD